MTLKVQPPAIVRDPIKNLGNLINKILENDPTYGLNSFHMLHESLKDLYPSTLMSLKQYHRNLMFII